MGFCSYCYQYVGRDSYGYSNECFGWGEARGCSGITGPDDPVRVARQYAYEAARAKELRAEARALRKETAKKAKALEQQAASYERSK